MGGKGSGGRRVGAGAKRKDQALRALDGNASHRGRVLSHPSAPVVPPLGPTAADIVVDEAHAPDTLTIDERRVWLKLAPLAIQKGTLTPFNEQAFEMLCKNIVGERALRLTDPYSPNHRGMIQRVDVELGDFGLRAFGKAAAGESSKPAVDPMKEKYFGSR